VNAYRLTSDAAQDLRDLWEYIAADNLDAADQLGERLYRTFDQLAALPRMGHLRPDLAGDRPLLFWPMGAYLIIYRADRHPLEIVAITHGSRDIPTLLRRRQQ